MGQLVYILGKSGTGKSYSMRNFPKDKLAVINVQGKILPFKGGAKVEQTATDQSDKIVKALEIYAKDYKSIVVDDYQYTMANEFMRRSTERGYDKFTDIGRHAWDIANAVRELPQDVIVYIMCHTDRDDEGNEKIKTIGKLLDEKICLEGMSTIVLKTNVTDGVYTFLTQNNGKDTVKSPAGMFPSYAIDNDLHYVDEKIRNYYELGTFLSDEEMAEIDKEVKKDDVPFTGGKTSRRSRRNNEEADTTANGNVEATSESNTRGRRKKATTEVDSVEKREAEREEVMQNNAEKLANAGLENGENPEGVPFEEVEMPELDKVPRRKRRTAEKEEFMNVPDMPEPEETTQEAPEEPQEQETTPTATPTRRRRRSANAE